MLNSNTKICYNPIGVIESQFKKMDGVPIQPAGANGSQGKVRLFDEYSEGLSDLDGFSHIILLYHFHMSEGFSLKVTPFLDDSQHGVFATRAPKRPNGIGMSVVKLLKIKKNILYVENVDILNGTPLLDIKPFVTHFDNIENEKNGWLSKNLQDSNKIKSDDRFI